MTTPMSFQAIRPDMMFGRLRVVSRAESRRSPGGTFFAYYHCVCTCGNTGEFRGKNLLNGNTRSCGCLRGEKTRVEVGMRFGRWQIIGEPKLGAEPAGEMRWYVACECQCGKRNEVLIKNLCAGLSRSCGCFQRERAIDVHSNPNAVSRSPLYSVWSSMISRCANPKNKSFARYGGRGIAVCAEWLQFPAFRTWGEASGYSAGLTLDRRDNDQGYNPGNCRWVTPLVNARNSSRPNKVQWEGKIVAVTELAERFGLRGMTVYNRIRRGWTLQRALETPSKGVLA
jgi:hypothetical protein